MDRKSTAILIIPKQRGKMAKSARLGEVYQEAEKRLESKEISEAIDLLNRIGEISMLRSLCNAGLKGADSK